MAFDVDKCKQIILRGEWYSEIFERLEVSE